MDRARVDLLLVTARKGQFDDVRARLRAETATPHPRCKACDPHAFALPLPPRGTATLALAWAGEFGETAIATRTRELVGDFAPSQLALYGIEPTPATAGALVFPASEPAAAVLEFVRRHLAGLAGPG